MDEPKVLRDLLISWQASVVSEIKRDKVGEVQIATEYGFMTVAAIAEETLTVGTRVFISKIIDETVTDLATGVQRATRMVKVSRQDTDEEEI